MPLPPDPHEAPSSAEATEGRPAAAPASPDRRAFEILVREHHRRLLAYALALTGREAEAEELAQEAFVTAWRNLAKFDAARGEFGRWLRGILRKKHLEQARERREGALDEPALAALEAEHGRWEAAVRDGRGEALAALHECLALLDALLRRTVEMFYLEKVPCAEIAARTAASEPAVRKRLQRARESLAECVRRKLEVG